MSGPEIAYFHSEIGLEVTFSATQQNRKPQTPSSVITGPVSPWQLLFRAGVRVSMPKETQ